MSGETITLIILIVLLIAAWPSWSYASSWGYTPSGTLTLLLVVFLVWAITSDRPLFRSSLHRDAALTSEDMRNTGRDVAHDVRKAGTDLGHDLKAAGRNVAESVRNTLQ